MNVVEVGKVFWIQIHSVLTSEEGQVIRTENLFGKNDTLSPGWSGRAIK